MSVFKWMHMQYVTACFSLWGEVGGRTLSERTEENRAGMKPEHFVFVFLHSYQAFGDSSF